MSDVRLIRIIFAALIGLSLAIAPVTVAVAAPAKAMEHCDKSGMGAKGSDAAKVIAKAAMDECPCCKKANNCSTDTCASKCFKVPGFLPLTEKTFDHSPQDFARARAELLALTSWPPPAPPPRT